jgi:hypothetical protein
MAGEEVDDLLADHDGEIPVALGGEPEDVPHRR